MDDDRNITTMQLTTKTTNINIALHMVAMKTGPLASATRIQARRNRTRPCHKAPADLLKKTKTDVAKRQSFEQWHT